jgi:site-specific recombinase XerD
MARRSPTAPVVIFRDADGLTTGQRQLVELAEDWFAAKRSRTSDYQIAKGNSDRARRGDLCRMARLICFVTGRDHADWGAPADVVADLGRCSLADFTVETMTRAIDAARTSFEAATVRRTMSTVRGFTRWLTTRGHLRHDPCADDELSLPPLPQPTPRSLETSEVDAMRRVAAGPLPPRARQLWWPARDVAIIDVLAGCGLRADELCSATMSWLDRRPATPILNVTGKGDKRREVPVARRVMASIDEYLDERTTAGFPATPTSPLFVRTTGEPLQRGVLDRIVRGLASRSGVSLPAGAAAHSLRHHYGTTLALHGVHMALLAQLMGHADPKTSAIYTRVSSLHLVNALDDAGLL